MLDEESLSRKILFGSDFYMVETERYFERRLPTGLRYALGGGRFWGIANFDKKTPKENLIKSPSLA